MTEQTLTGRHVAMIFGGAFSIIVGVNIVLAVSAVRTFPGLETRNSYVSSQSFEADRRAQEALGWTVSATLDRGQELQLRFDSNAGPVLPEITGAVFGRATHTGQDRDLVFEAGATSYFAPVPNLDPGHWQLRLTATAEDGTPFRRLIDIWLH